jgi:hypothetical protein
MSDEQEFLKALSASQQQPKTVGDEQEFLNALSKSKAVAAAPVAPPAPAATPAQQKPSALQEQERELEEFELFGIPVGKGIQRVREFVSGETAAQLPSLVAPQEKSGAQASRDLQSTVRSPLVPEYRKLEGGPVRESVQFGANVAAGAIGMAAMRVSLPLELGIVGSRAAAGAAATGLTDAATVLYDNGMPWLSEKLFGKLGAESLSKQRAKGQTQLAKFGEETKEATAELAQGVAFGFSPAAYTYVEGKLKGDPNAGKKAVEAMYAYPLESIMPAWHGAKWGMTRKGTPVTAKPAARWARSRRAPKTTHNGTPVTAKPTVERPVAPSDAPVVPVDAEVVRTVKGEPLLLNEFGKTVYEPLTKLSKYDTKIREKLGDTVGDILERGKTVIEPKWQELAFDAVTQRKLELQRGIAAARSPQNLVSSPVVDKLKNAVVDYNLLRDIETELADPAFKGATELEKFQAIEGTLGQTETIYNVPVLDKDSRAIATALGENLVARGMPVDTAQLAIPYIVLETVRANKNTGQDINPLSGLTDMLNKLNTLDDQQAAALVKTTADFVEARKADPNFLAAADMQWSGKEYRWVPGADVRSRDGYVRAFEQIRKNDAANGKPTFDISIPELGELRKDYVYQLYQNIVDDMRTSPQGQERVLQLLRSAPLSRMAANPTAPAHVKALAAWSNQPGGKRRQLVDLMNQAGLEASQNYGYDPSVIAKRFDRYLSRAFTDAIEADARMTNFLDQLESEAPAFKDVSRLVQTPRFKRKLSETKSNDRFVDLVNKGDISLHDALAATVTTTMAVNKHLANMDFIYNKLSELGMISDEPKAGYIQPWQRRVAEKGKAASNDPYNFVYGKLGDKYIREDLANQLNMTRTWFEKAVDTHGKLKVIADLGGEVLRFNRFTHTMLNQPGYLVRNALTDPTLTMVASGLTPYKGEGKKLLLEAQAVSDRFDRTAASPEGAVLSPMMREMEQQGFNLRVGPVLNDLPIDMRNAVMKQGDYIYKATTKAVDPMDRVGAMSRAAAYTRAYASTVKAGTLATWKAFNDTKFTRNFEKIMLQNQHEIEVAQLKLQEARSKLSTANEYKNKAAADAARAEVARLEQVKDKAQRRLDQTIQQSRAANYRVDDPDRPTIWPSQYMAHLNRYLNETAITYAAAKMERERAIWSYTIARKKLGLDPERAAIFVKEHVYGHERAPEAVRDLANNPLALVGAPLFVNYGLWQTSKYTRRVLNEPTLWGAYVLQQGLNAMNEHEILNEDSGESALRGRLAKIHLQRSAIPEVGLSTVGEFQSALKAMGWPESWVKAFGKPDDVFTFNMTDPIGGQTFLHQINPDRAGSDYFFQFGVYGPAVSQVFDANYRNFNDPGSMPMPGDPGLTGKPLATLRSILLATFPSTMHVKNIGFTKDVPLVMPFGRALTSATQQVKAKMEGKPVYKNMYGAEVSPLDPIGKEVGWVMPNPVDSAAYIASLHRQMEHKANVISDAERMFNSQLPPNMADQIRAATISEAHINATIKTAQMRLNYGWPMNFISRDEARDEAIRLEKMRVDAIKALKENKPNGEILVHMFDNPRINGFYDMMVGLEREALEDIEGDDDQED